MKIILQLFIAIIPLLFSFSTSDPTLSIRFLALSLIVLILSVIQFYFKKKVIINVVKHPFNVCLIIILLSFLFSLFVNGFSSEGIYNILKLLLGLLFFILITQYTVEHGYKDLIKSLVIFSLLVSFIYIYQFSTNYSNIIAIENDWKRNKSFDNIASSMGHKNLLSSINFLLLPFLFYSFILKKNIWRFFSLLSIILIFLILIQTQTRAVFAASIISLISYVVISRRNITVQKITIGFSFLIFFLSLSYILMLKTDRVDAFKSEIKKTFDFSATSRYKLYSSTLKLIKDAPFFGVGPGNWKINVWQYGLYFDSWGKSFAQRPHNDFLWIFAEGGFIAGISYILLFIILLRDSYSIFKRKNGVDTILFGLIFSVILGYGFISLVDFPFERISHFIIFLILASVIVSEKVNEEKIMSFRFPNWSFYILFSILCFTTYVAIIRYNGEVHTTKAIFYKSKGNWNNVIKEIDKGYNKSFYQLDNTSTPLLWYRGVANFNLRKFNIALKDFKSSYSINPFHVHVLNNLATLYELNKNSTKAKKYYNEVLTVCPTFKETRVNLAAILFNEKKYEMALDVILQSKVDLYSRRKKNNDNYDQYLKTIYNGFLRNITFSLSIEERKSLDKLKNHFNKFPEFAEKKIRSAYKIRKNEGINYVKAIHKVKW